MSAVVLIVFDSNVLILCSSARSARKDLIDGKKLVSMHDPLVQLAKALSIIFHQRKHFCLKN